MSINNNFEIDECVFPNEKERDGKEFILRHPNHLKIFIQAKRAKKSKNKILVERGFLLKKQIQRECAKNSVSVGNEKKRGSDETEPEQ